MTFVYNRVKLRQETHFECGTRLRWAGRKRKISNEINLDFFRAMKRKNYSCDFFLHFSKKPFFILFRTLSNDTFFN